MPDESVDEDGLDMLPVFRDDLAGRERSQREGLIPLSDSSSGDPLVSYPDGRKIVLFVDRDNFSGRNIELFERRERVFEDDLLHCMSLITYKSDKEAEIRFRADNGSFGSINQSVGTHAGLDQITRDLDPEYLMRSRVFDDGFTFR